MSSLIAKEIRLLLPAYILALLLAFTPLWLLSLHYYGRDSQFLGLALPLFGGLILALSSFGREFGMGTFSLLLAQPLPRRRIWWTKITVLACALATVGGTFMLSIAFWAPPNTIWSRAIAADLGIAFLAILASGLWAALLLRQMLAAFWMALVIPAAISILVTWMRLTEFTVDAVWGVYSLTVFGWAWCYFLRAQEVAWTGGAITLSGRQSLDAGARSESRARRPIAALLWKELQLYQVALMGMAGLFILHLGIIALRKAVSIPGEITPQNLALEMFGGVWLVVPLLTAGLSVTEERRLATLEGQLCLSVSSRRQFAIKLLFALVLSGELSALLLWTAEGIGDAIGAGAGVGGVKLLLGGAGLPALSVIFLAIAGLTFYASTLTRNFLQAMAAAAGVGMVLTFAWTMARHEPEIAGMKLWGSPLLRLISWPLMTAAIVWLAGGNIRHTSEIRRLWLRNARVILWVMLFSAGPATAIFQRIWEFLPLESAHGPARLSPSRPPTIVSDNFGRLVILLPDGKLWSDFIYYDVGRTLFYLTQELPPITSGGKWRRQSEGQFSAGTNWISVAENKFENVAIQSDGTLWISERATDGLVNRDKPGLLEPRAKMIKIGGGTDWKKVICGPDRSSMILLKTDGTVWRWSAGFQDGSAYKPSEHRAPLLRAASEPHELDAGTDWADLASDAFWSYGWEKNGRAWRFSELSMERDGTFDNTQWRSLSNELGVRADGTLWSLAVFRDSSAQIGTANDWVSVVDGGAEAIAAKSDGTLWKWDRHWILGKPFSAFKKIPDWLRDQSPRRLGNRNDWVALGSLSAWFYGNGFVSLASDGGIWCWTSGKNDHTWLAPSRKPEKIGNIFDQR